MKNANLPTRAYPHSSRISSSLSGNRLLKLTGSEKMAVFNLPLMKAPYKLPAALEKNDPAKNGLGRSGLVVTAAISGQFDVSSNCVTLWSN